MKINHYIYALAGAALMLFGMAACSPDDYDLGDKDVTPADLVEGQAYTITHDDQNPNIVYLKSLMADRYQVNWIEPQGRSQEKEVTLEIPFPGTYDVLFGVNTRGGYVYGDTAHFTVEEFCADFVNNELYTMLTGGVGQSKTWIPDNGNYGLCSGEISYGDPSATNAEWNNFTSNWDPAANHEDESGNFMKSSITFDLKDGANVQSVTYDPSGVAKAQKGTYLLDLDNHKLNLTDCPLLHSPKWDDRQDAVGWQKDIHIVTLTNNQLRLAILRNPDTSGEGKWWLCFNFVSKDYADHYEAPEVEVFPTLEDGWMDFVEPKNDRIITYKLTGFDWYTKDGKAKGVTAFDAIDNLEDVTIVMNSSNHSYTFTTPDGNETKGTYTLSKDGIYSFTPALPTFAISKDGRAVMTTNESSLRILGFSQETNCNPQTGGLDNIVWGAREYDDQGKFYQYMGYQWTVVRAGVAKTYKGGLHLFDPGFTFQQSDDVFVKDGSDGTYTFTINGSCNNVYGVYLDIEKLLGDHPNCDVVVKSIQADGKDVAFDDAAIDRGVGDKESTARRYIVNPWGASAGLAAQCSFSKTFSVTVEVKMDVGAPFVKPDNAKAHHRATRGSHK